MKKLLLTTILSGVTLLSACSSNAPMGSNIAQAPVNAHIPATQPTNITLLLPLSGANSAQARAVENGFFASYYQDKISNSATPRVSVLNTSGEDIKAVYQKAVKQHADLIVGPLLKEDVKTLESMTLPVPILALNNTNPDPKTSHNNSVFQFSLSPQNEAEQIADLAHNSGLHRAIIIAPAGSWGEGITNAFRNRWQSLGGTVVDQLAVAPEDNLTDRIKTLLHFSGNVRDQNSHNAQSDSANAERRRDVDVIFLAVNPTTARQIVPIMSYYYAGDIPIYATSLVYSGKPNQAIDQELNGVIFCDMPWAINQQNTVESQQHLSRLYALGEDAYLLSASLNHLIQGSSINGRTGQLTLDPRLQINRHLSCARFTNGIPQPLG